MKRQRTFGMLHQLKLADIQIRAAIVALQDQHPYKRLPIQFATSLHKRILDASMLSEPELDNLMAECEQIANDPETIILSFIVTQVGDARRNSVLISASRPSPVMQTVGWHRGIAYE